MDAPDSGNSSLPETPNNKNKYFYRANLKILFRLKFRYKLIWNLDSKFIFLLKHLASKNPDQNFRRPGSFEGFESTCQRSPCQRLIEGYTFTKTVLNKRIRRILSKDASRQWIRKRAVPRASVHTVKNAIQHPFDSLISIGDSLARRLIKRWNALNSSICLI